MHADIRKRFAARAIDLVIVFVAYVGTYWVAAALYYAVSGCADAGVTTVCGDDDAGGYVVIGIFVLGFVFPLIYDSALRRTLGKTVLDLEIVGRDGNAATRGVRFKRSVVTWAPLLLLAAGTLSTSADLSSLFGTVLLFYVVGVCALMLWDQPAPWDRLLGTRVVDRRAPKALPSSEGGADAAPVERAAPEGARPGRRRYGRVGRRR